MINWHPHKVWISLLALAILIGAGHATVLDIAHQRAERNLAALKSESAKTVAALQQLEQDIASSEKMKDEMDVSEADKYLAPVNRLRAAQILERLAAESRLSRFTYTFSPEEKTTIETLSAGKQDLALSKWTLAADAPTDADVFSFLDIMGKKMPGRIVLSEMSLERIGDKNAPISNANIHMTVYGEWLSNGASKDLAGGAP